MKTKICMTVCALLALCFVLGACTPHPTPDTQDSTEQQLTEQQTEQETQETTTEVQTDPPIEIEVPEGELPDLTALLDGFGQVLDEHADMRGKTVGQLKTKGGLTFIQGKLFAQGEAGLVTTNTDWDSVGFSKPLSTETYVACADFTVADNGRSGPLDAGMVGIYCKTAENLFVDGGLWFSFRDSKATVYVKQGFEKVIAVNLPFRAQDGISVRIEGNRQGATIYANDVLIATVEISNVLSVKNASGNVVATCALDNVSVDGSGYFRYMSHYANTTLASMSVQGETEVAYALEYEYAAFEQDKQYAFANKAQYLTALANATYSGVQYADAAVLAKMFSFAYTADANTAVMTRGDVTLEFAAGKTGVSVNGRQYVFPTTVYTKDTYMLPVAQFGQMMGYTAADEAGFTVLAGQKSTQEAMSMAKELSALYQNVIYNYDDVECDQTGVGLFEATPYEQRLVGIAYTTWHTASSGWGKRTWDIPLCGPYLSDDEKILRYHAELLRDAGVDFIFVDWSNNTDYDPVSMRDHREDFRMIEEATDKLFDVWKTVEGAPKICIFLGPGHNGQGSVKNGNHQKKADQVWRDYVTNPDRADMYFTYEGKPLVICYGATPTLYTTNPSKIWDDDRYTVRWITGYVGQQTNLFNAKTLESRRYWSWEERGAQTFTMLDGRVEAVTVSASTRSQGKEGDSDYIPAAGRENGATLKRQFQRACDLGAGIVLIVSWNEWTTGEQPSVEVSKDMEPSQVHGTFYYDLMREQIKKFKGQIPQDE